MAFGPSSDAVPDDALLQRVAGGDAQAFTTLFRRHQAIVFRFALHVSGDAAIAEDVTQDVFLAVMRDAGRYESGRSGAVAWLYGIARNCARQRLDRDRSYQPLDPSIEEQAVADQVHPLDDLTRTEGIEMLRKAILRLPLRYREALVLCDLQELTYAEAADALGCAIGTVRSRLHRARALLAARISAQREHRSSLRLRGARSFA